MTGLSSTIFGTNFWAGASILAGILILISGFADRNRSRRKNIEAVGFMPWTAITVFAVMIFVLSTALAIKGA